MTTVSSGAAVVADAVIPVPVELVAGEGVLDLRSVTVDAPDAVTERLAGELLTSAGASVVDGAVPVTLTSEPAAGPAGSANPERYTLTVTTEGVSVAAPERSGLLHAVRTLRQLANAGRSAQDAGPGAPLEVRAVVVRDEPRYSWRGLSFDVVRHWFGPADLRAVVDLVGSYKMNRLHLHLSDDQGWRLELSLIHI